MPGHIAFYGWVFFVGIEVKALGKLGNVSVLQRHQIKEINNTGGLAFVTDSLGDCQAKIQHIRDGILKNGNETELQSVQKNNG